MIDKYSRVRLLVLLLIGFLAILLAVFLTREVDAPELPSETVIFRQDEEGQVGEPDPVKPDLVAIVSTQMVSPAPVEDSESDYADHVYYSVVRVVDGDTLKIDMSGREETLRLIGMDTPEVVDPRKPVQCFGREASDKAKELLTGKRVRLELDPTQGERDKYRRLLAYIFLEDGLFFNQHMIAQGYAHEYTYNTPYRYQTEFQEAEKLAREAGLGLWSPDTCDGKATMPSRTPQDHFPLW